MNNISTITDEELYLTIEKIQSQIFILNLELDIFNEEMNNRFGKSMSKETTHIMYSDETGSKLNKISWSPANNLRGPLKISISSI